MKTAECLKKIRFTLCMSQPEFSRALDISTTAISLYERGKRQPSFKTIRKIIALTKKHKIKFNLEDITPEE